LWNGNEYDAEVIGTDPDTDLAVIKINANEDLPVAKLGDSDQLRVGQFAIALGSPRGFEGSLSFGHISALGRENLAGLAAQGLRFQNLIQTDAAINLGNSGGPLCNIDGEVIGINIAIVWGANSLGFAIPANTARDIVPQLIAEGHVTRGYLGVGIVDAREYAESLNLPDSSGAFVKKVQEGTPAERAGIEVYDVIRKINGEVVQDATDLVRKVSGIEPGKDVEVEVWRNEAPVTVDVMLDEWQAKTVEAPQSRSVLGIDVRAINPVIAERLGLPEGQSGVLITSIEPGSPAEEAGLQHGDIIIEIAREQVNTPEQFRDIMNREAQPGASVLIRYVRQGGDADITVLRIPAAE
ncbi:MAG: PDZ domain-containing protein, partial [Candidatus Hydrogenedentes bacterium]|nr:PDZ domain-containing protein [Candidatus Hydrogenedentota bacterium]